jgi:UDP-N-acetyl-D-glucosamine dehydrogenase
MRKYRFDLRSIPLSPKSVASFDAALIVTDHADVDYALLARHAKLIIDTRDAMSKVAKPKARVVKA